MNRAKSINDQEIQNTDVAQPQASLEIVDQISKVLGEGESAQLSSEELKGAVDFFRILDSIDQRLRKTPN